MKSFFIERILRVNGKSFKYVKKGKGELILLIHGWPENWASWSNQITFLSNLGYKVVAINTRGYADSFTPEEVQAYTLKYFSEDLIDIIHYFDREKAILIGHDWGAPICWTTAAYHPENVSAVVGLSVPYTKRGKVSSTQLWKKLYKKKFFYQNYFQKKAIPEIELEKNIRSSLLKIYYWCSEEGYQDKVKSSSKINSGLLEGISIPTNRKLEWLSKEYLKILIKDFKKSGFRGSINRYRAQDLDWYELRELDYLTISQPSIFIGGENDPVRRFIKDYDAFKNAGKYCDHYKGTFIIKNSGHWVQQEKSKEVNEIIEAFLKDIS